MWLWKSYIDNLCFYHRLQEYITSGRDKMIVDPYSDEIYTKRKTRLLKLLTERFPETSTLKHPSDGLGNSLERMPPFTQAEMKQLIESSGKRLGKVDHHSIPTNLRKDEYLKDIEANSDQRYFYLIAKCYHERKMLPTVFNLRFTSFQVKFCMPTLHVKLETLQPRLCLNV